MAYFKNYVKKAPDQPTQPVNPPPTPNPIAAQPQIQPQPIQTPTPQVVQPAPTPIQPTTGSFKQAPPKAANHFGFLKNPWVLSSVGIVLLTSIAIFLIVTGKLNFGGLVLGAKTSDESQKVIDSVAKLVILPTDKPSVANITNVEQLKARNAFFNSAQNGDKLLVYTSKVIIFRPKDNKIVDMSPVNVKSDILPTGTPTPTLNPNNDFVTP